MHTFKKKKRFFEFPLLSSIPNKEPVYNDFLTEIYSKKKGLTRVRKKKKKKIVRKVNLFRYITQSYRQFSFPCRAAMGEEKPRDNVAAFSLFGSSLHPRRREGQKFLIMEAGSSPRARKSSGESHCLDKIDWKWREVRNEVEHADRFWEIIGRRRRGERNLQQWTTLIRGIEGKFRAEGRAMGFA